MCNTDTTSKKKDENSSNMQRKNKEEESGFMAIQNKETELKRVINRGRVTELREEQKFLVETLYINHVDHNKVLKKLRKRYLAKIISKIHELEGSSSSLMDVCTFIYDNSCSHYEIMEFERCLYPLLPSPWNESPQSIHEESPDVILKRIEKIETFSRLDHKKYFDWRQRFMANIGVVPCPAIYKVQALFNSLQEDLSNFKVHTYAHGFNFYSYFLIIKDLERLYGDGVKIIMDILEDLYKNNRNMNDINSLIAFSTKLLKLNTIMKLQGSSSNNPVNKCKTEILNYLYQVMGTDQTNEFKSFCLHTDVVASVDILYEWVNTRIQEKSTTSMFSKLSKK